ncbi:MAG: YgjV family protein [Lachnospiraceae bacterium]|nr:YgjV family protein [Lachnospiraceae bacterium]
MFDIKILIELVGYLGSALVVVSMLMTSVKRLRIVNTVGSAIFTAYALIIRSYPTALMNLCLIIINIYQLIRLEKDEKKFRLMEGVIGAGETAGLLEYYEEDIRKYFPDFEITRTEECNRVFLVTYEAVPAGVLLGTYDGNNTMKVMVDYATPVYRDTSVGKFLYKYLPDHGVTKLVFSGGSGEHRSYLRKMGFIESEEGYVKEL